LVTDSVSTRSSRRSRLLYPSSSSRRRFFSASFATVFDRDFEDSRISFPAKPNSYHQILLFLSCPVFLSLYVGWNGGIAFTFLPVRRCPRSFSDARRVCRTLASCAGTLLSPTPCAGRTRCADPSRLLRRRLSASPSPE